MSREQMNVVVVGHVDHGKSTVIGRLLADTGSLPEGKLESVRRECRRTGKVFEYAFLLDALSDEQDQGITIDTARVFFKTPRRDYIIIDAPGHIEFLKNMVSGAARAEAAVLVIDAREGVQENSRRHGYLLSMLGIGQVVVLVNKMDLVSHGEQRFREIVDEYSAFLAGAGGVRPQRFIPVSALMGENLSEHAPAMPWYDGPPLLEVLDGFRKAPSPEARSVRMPVQAIYKFTSEGDDRRIVAGRLESGTVRVGDEVLFSPSGKRAHVKTIEAFNAPRRAEIGAGWSTGFTLDQELYITRGEILSRVHEPPQVGRALRANIIWLSHAPFLPGRDYKLKLGTAAVPVRLRQVVRVIDAAELRGQQAAERIERHAVAEVVLETRQPIAFDTISECEATGRFVIVDGYDVAGGGIITAAVQVGGGDGRRSFDGRVSASERAARAGHWAAVVVLRGGTEASRQESAVALERMLFDRGCAVAAVAATAEPGEALARAAVLADAGHIALVSAPGVLQPTTSPQGWPVIDLPMDAGDAGVAGALDRALAALAERDVFSTEVTI